MSVELRVAIVDDNPLDACKIASSLSIRLAAVGLPNWKIPVQLLFTPVFPSQSEEGTSFVKRTEKYLLAEAAFKVNRDVVPASYAHLFATDDTEGAQDDGSRLIGVIFDNKLSTTTVRGIGDLPTGVTFAQQLARIRPHLFRILVSGFDTATAAAQHPGLFHAALSKGEFSDVDNSRTDQALREILALITQRLSSPFWDALQEYRERPKMVFHAMAITDGTSVTPGGTAEPFLSHIGKNFVSAEASLTLSPLDSLFSPSGSLLDSQTQHATMFGGDFALYSTNGTSAMNQIVAEAICDHGDIVCLDRSCHISHFAASANAGTQPVYLMSSRYGDLTAPVSGADVHNAVTKIFGGRSPDTGLLPRLIVITNCSFDGIITKPQDIFEAYRSALSSIGLDNYYSKTAFLFDEAWMGYAPFHPQLIEYSAMSAARRLISNDNYYANNLRVYATTSVHKTMTAMRQASALVGIDHLYTDTTSLGESALKARFSQVLRRHSTTSPHATILASIDVARTQMVAEGTALLGDAMEAARSFRESLRSTEKGNNVIATFFRLVDPADILSKLGTQSYSCDPTKVVVQIADQVMGGEMKKLLWERGDIQVNKYSRNTILFMFMIGAAPKRVGSLITKLGHISAELASKYPATTFAPMQNTISPIVDAPANYVASDMKSKRTYPADLLEYRDLSLRVMSLSELGERQHKTLAELRAEIGAGASFVATDFITPYPPGVPVLLPRQIITVKELDTLEHGAFNEIHGATRDPRAGVWSLPVLSLKD